MNITITRCREGYVAVVGELRGSTYDEVAWAFSTFDDLHRNLQILLKAETPKDVRLDQSRT